MKLVVDVQYRDDDSAKVAGIVFENWNDETPVRAYVKEIAKTAPYEPGQFYKRELPCITELLEEIQNDEAEMPIDLIVIDGYVSLGSAAKPGLGMYLYESLRQKVPVVGVAKNSFHETPPNCIVIRGESTKPLYITTIGIDLQQAKECVLQMHGEHRIPTLLRQVDRLCRGLREQ